MRLETKMFGIKVVLIEPGAIKTEFGDVASASLTQNIPENSVYSERYKSMSALSLSSRFEKKMTDAIEIAELINKIINKKKPKARYVKGYLAKPMLFLGKYFPNTFDRAMRRFYRLN